MIPRGMLDIAYTAVIERKRERKEGALTAAFHVVEALTEEQCRAIHAECVGKPLSVIDADIFDFVTKRLAMPVVWQHMELSESEWREGRRE